MNKQYKQRTPLLGIPVIDYGDKVWPEMEMQKYKIIALLCKYITIFHNVHEDEIELALFTNNAINEIK